MTDESKPAVVTGRSDPESISVELSARRTGMSFQRTRMSADRTLMSVIRTSLSLIGFGFTIAQFFQKLHESGMLKSSRPAVHFGVALVAIGVVMLIAGIGYHVAFMVGLRRERDRLRARGLIHAESTFPLSLTLMTAIILLGVGLLAIADLVFGIGPF